MTTRIRKGAPVIFQIFKSTDHLAAHELWSNSHGISLGPEDEIENIDSFLKRNRGFSFTAKCNGKLVGTVLSGHDGRRGLIYHLCVDSQYRNLGIARVLIGKVVEKMKRDKVMKIHVLVKSDNSTGLKFWSHVGAKVRSDLTLSSISVF